MQWRDISADPNSPEAIAARRAVLEAARVDHAIERHEIIRRYCAGRRVADLGCVDHLPASSDRPGWLHRIVVEVAEQCVGVDNEPEGVAELRRWGYNVLLHDITNGAGPLAEMEAFDVVVAGELIEHLDRPGALLELARDVLRPGGHLIVTTPNPYGRTRARFGQIGITWENVDHVAYIPPTGMAEMAERTGGLHLILYGTEGDLVHRPSLRSLAWRLRAWALRTPAPHGHPRPPTLLEWIVAKPRSPLWRGEGMVYVLQKMDAP